MADEIDVADIFQDPEGYYPPEKEPTYAEHHMLSGQKVRVRLVGSHPLYVRANLHPLLFTPYLRLTCLLVD